MSNLQMKDLPADTNGVMGPLRRMLIAAANKSASARVILADSLRVVLARLDEAEVKEEK
jgi:hypothetical protein